MASKDNHICSSNSLGVSTVQNSGPSPPRLPARITHPPNATLEQRHLVNALYWSLLHKTITIQHFKDLTAAALPHDIAHAYNISMPPAPVVPAPSPPPLAAPPSKRIAPPEDDGSLQQDVYCCPVCTMHYGSSILQCKAGHCICVKCFKNLESSKCPTCRVAMPHPAECLFALQQARAAGVLRCASPGCDFTGAYDAVCTHEQQLACHKSRQHSPCLIVQLFQKLVPVYASNTLCMCPTCNNCEDIPKCHIVYDFIVRDNYFMFCASPCISKGFVFQCNIIRDSTHGLYLLFWNQSPALGFFHIAFICLDKDNVPVDQRRIEFMVKRKQDHSNLEVGLRLEGEMLMAKQVLAMPAQTTFDTLPQVVHVHRSTIQPYIHVRPGETNERVSLTIIVRKHK
jgi:hypothetical protein